MVSMVKDIYHWWHISVILPMFFRWMDEVYPHWRCHLEQWSYYQINELAIGGHCGCCGRAMPREIFPKFWRWGICESCLGCYIEPTGQSDGARDE